MKGLSHVADVLLTRLVWTSIQATVLIIVVLLIVRALPRLPAAMRCMLWWLVSLQLVLGLCWHAPVALPLLSPAAAVTDSASVGRAPIMSDQEIFASPAAAAVSMPRRAATLVGTVTPGTIPWRQLLPLLWLAAMLLQLPLLAGQWWRTRRLLDSAEPLADASMQAVCAQHARALGLHRVPPLYVSSDIDSPQVSGLRQPVVLLPATHAMTTAESAMAIAHELAHLRRGDLWLGWLPAIARRLFFFHPLVRWALREYAFEREAACDAEVLRQTGTLPHAYARLLLRLGVSHPIHAGIAGASPTFRNLKRRLSMLQHFDPVSRRHLRSWLLVALVAAAGVLPYRVTAASNQHDNAARPMAGNPTAVPIPPLAPMPPAPPISAPPAPASTVRVPPAPITPPPLPPPPPPPPSPRDLGFAARQVDIETTNDAQDGFALFDGDSKITINGSNADLEAVKKLHAANKSMLWFRRGDHAYLIKDKGMLERASGIYAPVTALARQQAELAGQQGAVAGTQAGLAARDAAFAQRQAALARQQAEVASQQADMAARTAASRAVPSDQQAQQSELDARQREMDAAQAQLDKRHAELESNHAARQQALETQQAGFEKKQQVLDHRQQQAQHAAEQAMSRLLDEALAKGLAQKASLH
ncbi:MAG: M56 family metallopeptidase [Rhodanobacter sp.]